jgi:hypothetical protein
MAFWDYYSPQSKYYKIHMRKVFESKAFNDDNGGWSNFWDGVDFTPGSFWYKTFWEPILDEYNIKRPEAGMSNDETRSVLHALRNWTNPLSTFEQKFNEIRMRPLKEAVQSDFLISAPSQAGPSNSAF